MTPNMLKSSWLTRESQFLAFTNGPLLDFWEMRDEREFIGVDNVSIHYVKLCSSGHDKAIIILPGRSESYIKYSEIAYDFFYLGYDIFIIDHRGQGRSGRMLADSQKGHVEKFTDYIDDFESFIRLDIKPRYYTSCYAISHSMGGAILSGYLLRDSLTFNAAVLCAPMMGINFPISRWLVIFFINCAVLITNVRNNYVISTGKWQPLPPYMINILTHSYERYRHYLRYYTDYPELRLGGPTYHWIEESIQFCTGLIKKAGNIKVPLMLLQASEDKVVSNQDIQKFCVVRQKMQIAKEKKLLLIIDGAGHEILFENDILRAKALNAICKFFEQY